ncbi:hypothetical protein [Candidatus Methylomicrobium oryzae]|uniref:hypothetical protein n=1 Tax=Candidatus Methylomicrobium oryzae TaxID=2802053 RepID=UPI0019250161|nr:hypothetical protein [Methylomicrobium sp. RS1]MBL1264791.1 hypothetical protein [Methylomicrobium sp. RS1]
MNSLLKYFITTNLLLSACSNEEFNKNSTYINSEQVERTDTKIKERDSKVLKIAYATTPFDISSKRLPLNYEGHNPEEYFINAQKIYDNFIKGEFETTKQFQKRVDYFQPPPFIKTLDNNGEFAFRVVPSYSEYNADLQEFSIKIDAESRSLDKYGTGKYSSYYDYNEQVLVVKYLKEGESWESPTVLGIILGDALQRPKELKQHLLYENLKLHIPIEKAEDAKKKINLLIIIKPKIPYTEHIYRTTDHPPYIPLKLIVGHIISAWWYNYETGEIYKKLTLSPRKSG